MSAEERMQIAAATHLLAELIPQLAKSDNQQVEILQHIRDTLTIQNARLDALEHSTELLRDNAQETRPHVTQTFEAATDCIIKRIHEHLKPEIQRIANKLNLVTGQIDLLCDRYDKHTHALFDQPDTTYTQGPVN